MQPLTNFKVLCISGKKEREREGIIIWNCVILSPESSFAYDGGNLAVLISFYIGVEGGAVYFLGIEFAYSKL